MRTRIKRQATFRALDNIESIVCGSHLKVDISHTMV